MIRRLLVALLVLGLLTPALIAPASAQSEPRRPFPQHVDYGAGTIRPNQVSQTRLDRDVRRFYRHWRSEYLVPAGTDGRGRPLYRVSFGRTDPSRTVSEGQGYGMLIVATMAGSDPDAQQWFDGLWLWSRRHPSTIDPGLMTFVVPPGQGDSAFDGDADIAYALLLADAQWGSDGDIDYAAAAGTVLASMLRSTIGADTRLPLLGDWVGEADGGTYSQDTWRTSDCMPGHFDAFARFTGIRTWREVARQCVRQLGAVQRVHSPTTGLLPDFIVDARSGPDPAPPMFLEADTDGAYSYNAFRVPWRIGVDALLNDRPASLDITRRLARWARAESAGDPRRLGAGYLLDGSRVQGTRYFTSVVVAPLAVGAMTSPRHRDWLNEAYDAVRIRHEDYYEDSVTLLSLFALSRNWWDPTRPVS